MPTNDKPLTEKQKARMRIRVAEDILKTLKVRKIQTGTYLHGQIPADNVADVKKFEAGDSKTKAKIAEKYCETCALGACLLSTVKLYNKFDTISLTQNGYVDIDPLYKNMAGRLRKIFSPEQLQLIESAFEFFYVQSNGLISTSTNTYEELFAAANFGKRYLKDANRLRAIMRNLITNGGEFIPNKAVKKAADKERALAAAGE